MFHELLTIVPFYEQFTDFNGLFSGFLSKFLFLCARETLCEPNAVGCLHLIAEAMPVLFKHCAGRMRSAMPRLYELF